MSISFIEIDAVLIQCFIVAVRCGYISDAVEILGADW